MNKLLILSIFLVSSRIYAEESQYHLLNVEKLELDYHKLNPNNRDPYAPEYTGRWRERAALLWRISILGPLYWDNNIHTETIDSGQVKTVGWEWEAGLRINELVSIGQHHHSRHIMDESGFDTSKDSKNYFPVENSYFIKIQLLKETTGKPLF